jgi:hypothetical protein
MMNSYIRNARECSVDVNADVYRGSALCSIWFHRAIVSLCVFQSLEKLEP